MTPEAQRIAIAEACGWTNVSDEIPSPKVGFVHGSLRGVNPEGYRVNVPDYLNDLNAMHEAEKALDSSGDYSKQMYYASILGQLTQNDNGRGWQPLSNDDCFRILHATAAQRAEAFLKTLSLWDADEEAKLHANIMNQIDPFGQEVY